MDIGTEPRCFKAIDSDMAFAGSMGQDLTMA